MTKAIAGIILFGFLSTSCSNHVYAQEKGKYKRIRCYMDRAVTEGLTGISVYISSPKNGEWVGVSGYSDIEARQPIQINNIFSLASIGKMYNAVAALMLAERGVFRLEDKISKYLPDDIIENLAHGREITVRHLLGQTSGLVNYENDSVLTRLYFSGKLKLDTLARVDALRRYVFGRPALNRPGETFHYSSTNYLLLAMIVDKVTPEGHSVYLRELIDKHGFPNTYYRQTPPHQNVRYYGDLNRDGLIEDLTAQTFETTNWFTGDDGVYAPITEAAHFLQAVMKGKILKPSSLDQMTAWNNNESPDYGLGLMADKSFPYGLLMGHSGRGIGVTTDLYYFPKRDMTVAIFCNTGLRGSAPAFRRSYHKMRSRIVKKLFLF
ncbi:MAG TPA: serine hydrolase domain-containing protein [Cyclobacteriaceae bacterium]|nr:serine hydrolase domain-containing protein [Cyclobacteriaceae bacterium]